MHLRNMANILILLRNLNYLYKQVVYIYIYIYMNIYIYIYHITSSMSLFCGLLYLRNFCKAHIILDPGNTFPKQIY